MIREVIHVLGLTGFILSSVVNREIGEAVWCSANPDEQKLGAEKMEANPGPKIWMWSESVGRRWTMMAEDVHVRTLMHEGMVGPSIGIIMRKGRKEMDAEVKEWGEAQGVDAEVVMELSENIKMRYPSNWMYKGKVKDANWRIWVIRIGNPVGERTPAWEFVSGWLERRKDDGDVVDVERWRDMWMGGGKVSMGDKVRRWVEGLMNRERQGRRFYGKCTNAEVVELKRLGVARPTEAMREIETLENAGS